MDPLRLVLIVCGVLLIAAIYAWEKHKQRRRAARARRGLEDEEALVDRDPLTESPEAAAGVPVPDTGEDADVDLTGYDIDEGLDADDEQASPVIEVRARPGAGSPVEGGASAPPQPGARSVAPARDDDAVAPLSGLAARRDGPEQLDLSGLDLKATAGAAQDEPGTATHAGGARRATAAAGAESARDDEALVVGLTVMASPGEHFSGPALREALENAGMRLGDMRIYHRHAEDAERGPLFSAANVLKPGYLDEAATSELSTPGVVLFMRLPGPGDPGGVFQSMLDTATRLAEDLHGQVCDERRSKLTAQSANHLRERIGDFARRQMLKA